MYKGEWEIYQVISKNKTASMEELANTINLPIDTVRRAVESLKAGGYVTTSVSKQESFKPNSELSNYVQKNEFPEYLVYLKAKNGAKISDLTQIEKSIGLGWAKKKQFVMILVDGKLTTDKSDVYVADKLKPLSLISSSLGSNGTYPSELKFAFEELLMRNLLESSAVASTQVSFSGKTMVQPSDEFDVSSSAADAYVAKAHPISALSEKIRKIMSEMGFEEMEGDIVESSFWNFDALFQPQDHPARELADTFYLNGTMPLPTDRKLVERIKRAHTDGWKYQWSEKEASKMVLRTHTTALSARYLSQSKDKNPKKYFAVGRVFRNEATDYKHLAEFHQVEGIIAWEGAKFTDLLGILKEFYKKLGFEKIRFRPSFFPYTEPSLEIEVYFEPRKQWLELGGAGIFRPEVSVPLAGVYPVLAWGLSLERPLMLSLGLEDIRSFYKNDLEFLKNSRLDL